MKNVELAAQIIQELVNAGVEEFVVCAGARNSPLVYVLAENPHLKVYSFFEERSAGFFALGRMASLRRPVAVFTTSGTAVAELLPAAVEGTYSSLPLVMVTADRPKQYRGTGAPQAIEQVGIFSYYTEVTLDIDTENSHLSLKSLSWKKPIHINVCFDEPLIDSEIPRIAPRSEERRRFPAQMSVDALREIEGFLSQHNPVVVVGILPEKAYGTVLDFLRSYKAPVYCEGISSLRGHPDLKGIELRAGEQMVARLIDSGVCDSVLRIGGVPTLRLWRDLEGKYKKLPVFSVGFNHYTGVSRSIPHVSSLEILSQVEFERKPEIEARVTFEDEKMAMAMRELLQKYPRSEQGMIFALSRFMHGGSVYLGNSLPIRYWDSSSSHDSLPRRVAGNRGANGIDGQISTFLGWAHENDENWCLVGDLTALYDLSSLWVTSQISTPKLKIVVMNNGGGQIFQRMFKKDIFLNKHAVSFASFAKMWNWSYQEWDEIPASPQLSDRQIIELKPDPQQTDDFWREYEVAWKK